MFNRMQQLQYMSWFEVLKKRVAILDVDRRPANLCWSTGVGVMNSMPESKRAEIWCLARVHLKKRMVIGYYSGTLMYMDLYGGNDWDGRYGEKMISVTVKKFHAYSLHTSTDAKDSDGKNRFACKGPPPVNSLHFISDTCCLEKAQSEYRELHCWQMVAFSFEHKSNK